VEQLEFFSYSEPAVPKPKRTPAPGKVSYTRIGNRKEVKCEDCMELYLEMEFPPIARVARFRRVTSDGDQLLCLAHAQQHLSGEQLEKARCDREEFTKKKNRYSS
jgi:hypothetical protein